MVDYPRWAILPSYTLNYYTGMLREALWNATKQYSDVTHALISGGLDSSIAAYLVWKLGVRFKGILVSLEEGTPTDLMYSHRLAKYLGIELVHIAVGVDETLKLMEDVIKTLATFDPMEVVNSTAIYTALKYVEEDDGIAVLTGDGADELFAGYSYMHEMDYESLENYIGHLTRIWRFSSIDLAKPLGLEIRTPYLEPKVVEVSLKIPARLKVVKIGNRTVGKYVLRKAFENYLPQEIIWRDKHPIEQGSGFNILYRVLEELSKGLKIPSNIRFWGKAQPYLYKIFTKYHKIRKPSVGEKRCPYCGSGIPRYTRYCRVCGAYPV